MKVVAVIVTFNRPTKLEKSVRSIYAGQNVPYKVLVVDNNSTDNTRDVLVDLKKDFDSLEVVQTKKNLGGAGGFYVGLKAAYDLGASHFWVMDDDAYCLDNSLSELVSAYQAITSSEEVGFLCSRIDWTDGQICQMNQPEAAWDWMRCFSESSPILKVRTCSFVSCFFSREVLETVGLPIKEFFIWFDDIEFTNRISKLYPCYAIMNSIVVHDIPNNLGVYYADIDNDNFWKFAYGASNESWFRFWRKSPLHWLLFFAQKNRDMHKGGVSLKNRAKVNWNIFSGIFQIRRPVSVSNCALEPFIR